MTRLAAPPTQARHILLALVVAAAPVLSFGDAARAQGVDLNTEHVTVDLSVIGDMGGPMPPGAASTSPMAAQPRGAGGLLVPGPAMPTSRLHVAVPGGPGGERITLKPPSAAPKKTVAAPAAKTTPGKAPAPAKPAEKTVATAPPAPLTTPPPAPTMPAEPTVKAGPPAPPPAAAQPEKKPEPTAKTAAAPAPAAPPAARPQPVKTEQASTIPPAAVMKEGRALQVAFADDVSKLPDPAKDGLTTLAKQLKENESLRLQLLAYAGGKDLSPSKARRLSLSRALSVRSFLIENGVRSTRIDVRALGDKTSEEPLNRVDVNIVER